MRRRLHAVLFVAFSLVLASCSPTSEVTTTPTATAAVSSVTASQVGTGSPPASCPVTRPPNPLFVPPSPYPPTPPPLYVGQFWYGTETLWTMVGADGMWQRLPYANGVYVQKTFWWRRGYDWQAAPDPALVVTGKRLNAPPLQRIYERWVSAYQGQWASSLLGIQQIAEQGRAPAREVARMETVQIEQEVAIDAAPDRVFAALVDPDAWWRLRYTDLPQEVTFEPKIGGRFYQGGEDRQGSLWATVTHIEPGKKLTLRGTMAMRNAVAGVVNFDLALREEGTLLTLQHYAIGPINEETRASYANGWKMLLGDALAAYVERGVQYAPHDE